MSHTDKDRPYWVKLNDDGVYTDHDHLRCGKEVYRYDGVRDENGNLIYDSTVLRTVPVLLYVVADRCTEGEKLRGRKDVYSAGGLPCTPRLPRENLWWLYAPSKRRQSELREYNGHKRAQARSTLRNMVKAANGRSENWEDDFEEVERLTDASRHSVLWGLC